jgi:hypothetical protein
MNIQAQQHTYLYSKSEKTHMLCDSDLTSHKATLAPYVIYWQSQDLRKPRSNTKCEESNSSNLWIFILKAEGFIGHVALEE